MMKGKFERVRAIPATQTIGTGVRVPRVSLAAMAQKLELLTRFMPMPLTEVKMHPDDYAELKRTVPAADGSPAGFSGVRIVVDPEAPRLPRKSFSSRERT